MGISSNWRNVAAQFFLPDRTTTSAIKNQNLATPSCFQISALRTNFKYS